MEIPAANHHGDPEKVGYLNKLSSRNFPYIPQWRRRFCVLSKGKLYYYEKEDSKKSDKSSGVINLEYFDQIFEAAPKDCKKATNVFIVTSQDRSFFDAGRHLFSAETLTDLHDWIRKIQHSLDQIRNNNRPNTIKSKQSTLVKEGEETGWTRGIRQKEGEETGRSKGTRQKDDQIDSKTSTPYNTNERKRKKEEALMKANKACEVSASNITTTNSTQLTDDLLDDNTHGTNETVSVRNQIEKKGGPLKMEGLLGMAGRGCELPASKKEDDFDMPKNIERLQSITKQRPRPKDRKLPSKRVSMMKNRTQSLGTLQDGQPDQSYQQPPPDGAPSVNRSTPWLNQSLDLLEEEVSRQSNCQMTQSALAYNYSSDETDDEGSHSDSFTTSASGFAPEPPPRMSSYAGTLQPPIPGPKPIQTLLPLGSLPSLHESEHKLPYEEEWRGSACSMGASPVMDDLDNLLMNQSVQAATPLDSPSSAGGSEISTCKAVGERAPLSPTPDMEVEICNTNTTSDGRSSQEILDEFVDTDTKSSTDLSKFTITIHHLQRHIVDLDHDLHGLTSEIVDFKSDMSALQESVSTIKSDTDRVGETVAILSKEAARASRQIVAAAQEAEKTQRLASLALEEAEKTKGEYKKLKNEYEEIVEELRTTLSTLKAGASSQKHKHSLDHSSASNPSFQSLERRKNLVKANTISECTTHQDSSRNKSNQSNNKDEINQPKLTGYQSLFVRPSSIILGLTNRAYLTKSVSFADQNDKKKKESEKDSKKEKKDETKEKDSKTDKKNYNSLERKSKNSKRNEIAQNSIEKITKDQSLLGITKLKGKRYNSEAERALSNESLDDIPMMDENFEHFDRSQSSLGFSKMNINVKTTENNFNLGKSSSTPSVADPVNVLRPKILPIAHKPYQANNCNFNLGAHSPDSPTSSTTALYKGYNLNNNIPAAQTTSLTSLYRPSSACGQLMRQSSMTTVPEEHVISTPPPPTKPRVFAISRQNSTPNLPIQRQSSTPIIPLQRQYSLGTVPEENKLPRQDSLLSVPEEKPVVDQTLPLSPAGSIQCLSVEDMRSRGSIRNSLELVAGPIVSGSSFQQPGYMPSINAINNNDDDPPMATSSLKKDHNKRKSTDKVGVVV